MIASNSARSSWSSAYTSARNSSSTVGVAPWAAAAVALSLITNGQALMACRASFLLLISTLRALACSATGICSVRTPLS